MFKIDNKFSNANVSRTVRFTDKLFGDLSKTSEKFNISFNSLVLQCCQYALDNLQDDSSEQNGSEDIRL